MFRRGRRGASGALWLVIMVLGFGGAIAIGRAGQALVGSLALLAVLLMIEWSRRGGDG